MRRSDFHYELPPALIAQHPLPERAASRLLYLDPVKGAPRDAHMADFPGLLRAGDLLVFNDTRVIPARLLGQKDTGGRVEILIERVLAGVIEEDLKSPALAPGAAADSEVLALVRASKTLKPGNRIRIDGTQARFEMLGREAEFFRLRLLGGGDVHALLQQAGHMPLPPYIKRDDADKDRERYQTVFAREPGAVAAPTAGLHFDQALLEHIRGRGVDTAFITLHVGAGTFQPLRVDDLSQHRMHPERYSVPAATLAAIQRTRSAGGRVVAVGTTVVRTLESAAFTPPPPRIESGAGSAGGEGNQFGIQVGPGETRLFITPGFEFQVVDALLTNFHLPESTLLMLVCAFAGQEQVLAAYRHAVQQRYRFFSYGDAMFIPKRVAAGA